MKKQKKTILLSFLMCSAMNVYANEYVDITSKVRTHHIPQEDLDLAIPNELKHSFDIDNEKQFYTVLRFLDMHLEAGVKPENLKTSIVIHGHVVSKLGKEIGNKHLQTLIDSKMVDIYVCGQSLSNKKLDKKFLHPDIKLSLSAMTAHHYLQKQGYTYNPF